MSHKKLTSRSPARITLALDIIRKISDDPLAGYHELGIIKHKLDLFDTITVTPSTKDLLTCDDPTIPTDTTNTCFQTVELLKEEFNIKECVHIHIEKHIPAQGGLAGGSSNAATTFLLLNQLWKLNLSKKRCIELGKKIGMDIPFFFLDESTAYDTETTGILEPIKTPIHLNFILVFPLFGISTKNAYANINYTHIAQHTQNTSLLKEQLSEYNKKNAFKSILEGIHNDFEISVFKKFPKLAEIKKDTLDAGALAASMTGSGSTLYGIARDQEHAEEIALRLPYKTFVTSTYIP